MCEIINFQERRRLSSPGRRRRDSILAESPIAAQVIDAIAGTNPEGVIFITLNEHGISYGLYGSAENHRTATKFLMRVVSDIKNSDK